MDELRQEMLSKWNSTGHEYDERHAIDDNDRVYWASIFAKHKEGSKLLDIGTGTGFIALIAAENKLDATGLDWSPTMLDLAKEKADSQNLMVGFVQCSAEGLPFEDCSFDIIALRHVLWTLAEPEKAFVEWLRVLKPGGLVYADYSPRKGEEHLGYHYSIEAELQLPFNNGISPESIASVFSSIGFGDVSYEELDPQYEHGRPVFFFTCKKHI